MNAATWLMFGVITSIIAHLLDPSKEKGGFFGTLLLGVSGAMVGGLMTSVILGGGLNGFNVISFAIAVGGSLLLLFVQRAVRRTEG
jgi:uncharacterized membrane protein YeaQ/YmgE (transglycosylase-associated protein family)